ncbi:signal recognition particle-docking protein FtsY [Thalassotalea crassostreae]|uniref:signal recognition particle-docking protein FtsY n=1 Tax=Thalassotalea crassostreae TaxID=1763536 RepID=UPI0008384020|nr:signal recognition particle-docking protein FtsY [Thalassotalea crassostreae]
MAKKKGLFSWFKKEEQHSEEVAAEQEVTDNEQLIADDNADAQKNEEISISDEATATQAVEETHADEIQQPAENVVEDIVTDTIADTTADVITEGTSEQQANIAETDSEDSDAEVEKVAEVESTDAEKPKKEGFFARLKQGLSKTRQNLGGGIFDLFSGKKIDDELFEELETQLLLADVGVDTTMKIIDSLTESATRKQLKNAETLYDLLKEELSKILNNADADAQQMEQNTPHVILMVGVNGVGKTTTIGKMAKQFQAQGKSVMLAAGDTFRAAAVEQLQVWGERNDIAVVAQHTGADSASVIFDAINSAKSKGVDVLIADTAGRLQNKAHLMEELKKVVRVMKKIDENAPHEVMLTIDAGTGQNAISQTQLFHEAVGLTGINVTKLDGTAKGGVVFALADKFNLPIRYLGVGEGIDDLRQFDGKDFIEALFERQ